MKYQRILGRFVAGALTVLVGAGVAAETTSQKPAASLSQIAQSQQVGGLLSSGVPQAFRTNRFGQVPILLNGFNTYSIDVPAGTTRLRLKLATSTPGADIDLVARFGTEPVVEDGAIVADFFSETFSGFESFVISDEEDPPLQAGTYFFSLVLRTGDTSLEGTVEATIDNDPFRGKILRPGETTSVIIEPTDAPLIASVFQTVRVAVPDGATALEAILAPIPIRVAPDMDLFGRFGEDIDVAQNGDVLADYESLGPDTNEMIRITAASDPPLRPGEYFFSTGTQPNDQFSEALITINVEGGPPRLTTTSSASFGRRLTSGMLVSSFGTSLAVDVLSATTVPLPTELGGTIVEITDSAGMTRRNDLIFVAPGQVNSIVNGDSAMGPATMTIRNGASVSREDIVLEECAPGLFSANATGRGVPAAIAIRVLADGTQIVESVEEFDAGSNQFVPRTIDLSASNGQVFMTLFGTGFSNVDRADVEVFIADIPVPVGFAGPQGGFAGLDQINIGPLPIELIGEGEVGIIVRINGKRMNTLLLRF